MSTKLDADGMATKAAGSDYRYTAWRKGYADAIREVAQPITDERDELLAVICDFWNDRTGGAKECGHEYDCVCASDKVRSILAKHPKP